MSGRSARANVDYDGKVFDLDFKTWKTYAAEFDGPMSGERETSHPGPDMGLAPVPTISAAPLPLIPLLRRRGGRRPGVRKTRFLVALSNSRLDQLKAEALRKDKTYAALAIDYIIEGLERAERTHKQS